MVVIVKEVVTVRLEPWLGRGGSAVVVVVVVAEGSILTLGYMTVLPAEFIIMQVKQPTHPAGVGGRTAGLVPAFTLLLLLNPNQWRQKTG